MRSLLASLGVLLCVGYSSAAFASPIAVWDFESSGLGVSSTAANVTGGDVTFENTAGSGFPVLLGTIARGVAADGSSYAGGNPINTIGTGNAAVTVGNSARARTWPGSTFDGNSTRAYGFSITIADGYELYLSDVTFDMGFMQGSVSGIRVEYSTSSDFSNPVVIGLGEGFDDGTQEGLGYGEEGTLGIVRATNASNVSWNRFTNLGLEDAEPLTGTIYFRITGRGHNWNNDNQVTDLYLDNLAINGTLVPEPGSLLLLGTGSLLLLTRRR